MGREVWCEGQQSCIHSYVTKCLSYGNVCNLFEEFIYYWDAWLSSFTPVLSRSAPPQHWCAYSVMAAEPRASNWVSADLTTMTVSVCGFKTNTKVWTSQQQHCCGVCKKHWRASSAYRSTASTDVLQAQEAEARLRWQKVHLHFCYINNLIEASFTYSKTLFVKVQSQRGRDLLPVM